jgi:hypothetical protein
LLLVGRHSFRVSPTIQTLQVLLKMHLVMKGVLRHSHQWLMSLILCHHVICTDTLVKVCVYDVHALPIHIVHIHLCSSDHSSHMWLRQMVMRTYSMRMRKRMKGFFSGQGILHCNYVTLRFHFSQHIAPLTYAKYYQRMMIIQS